jgi:hypothetical protein
MDKIEDIPIIYGSVPEGTVALIPQSFVDRWRAARIEALMTGLPFKAPTMTDKEIRFCAMFRNVGTSG